MESAGENKVAFRDRIGNFLIETFGPMVCAISGTVGEARYQFGTGTLFRIGERHFLVTAAHVLRDLNKAGAFAHIGDYLRRSKGVSINGLRVMAIGGQFDLSLVEIPPSIVEMLPNRRWLMVTDFAFEKPIPGDEYFVCGFQSEFSRDDDNEQTYMQEGILFHTKLAAEDDRQLENYDPNSHLLFEALPSGATDSQGNVMPLSLKGISGCAVWRVISGRNPDAFDPNDVKMIGVETAVYEGPGLIKATIWGGVLTLLWSQYEDVRPSLRFHLPERDVWQLSQNCK